jgi:excisionase family DNA binding protein
MENGKTLMDSIANGEKLLFRPTEAAKLLGISTKTLRRHTRDGNFPYVIIGLGERRRYIAFSEKGILELLQRQQFRGREPFRRPRQYRKKGQRSLVDLP